MDIATFIGLFVGMTLVLGSIMLAGASLSAFIDVPSIAIVFGGALASTLIAFPLKQVLTTLVVIRNAFVQKRRDLPGLVRQMVQYAEIARRDGILALEAKTDEIDDAFILTGVQMAVDGTDPELIQKLMQAEMDTLAHRHKTGKSILDTLNKYAPAYGMIGTLIGLVIMLGNMDDPNAIGPGMAVALLTTLYGSVASNLIFAPLADKLAFYSKQEMLAREIILRGVMSIQSGDNPRVVEQKLKIFLPPRQRAEDTARAA